MTLTEITPVTAETTVDEISAYLTERDVEHTRTADGAIKLDRNGHRIHIYQHCAADGADIAGLWAYNVVGDCSDGLDSMEDLAWLIG